MSKKMFGNIMREAQKLQAEMMRMQEMYSLQLQVIWILQFPEGL